MSVKQKHLLKQLTQGIMVVKDNSSANQEELNEDAIVSEEPSETVIGMRALTLDADWSTSFYDSLEDLKLKDAEKEDNLGSRNKSLKLGLFVILLLLGIGALIAVIVIILKYPIQDLSLKENELKTLLYLTEMQEAREYFD